MTKESEFRLRSLISNIGICLVFDACDLVLNDFLSSIPILKSFSLLTSPHSTSISSVSQVLIKVLFNQIHSSIHIHVKDPFLYENLKGILLVITGFDHPLEKIRAFESKFTERLRAMNPQGIVLIKNLYHLGNGPLG